MSDKPKSQPVVVLITAPSSEVGERIAALLLERRLAACVNLLGPVHSLYTWQGEIHSDQEVLLLVKSRAELFEEHLIPAVREVHPYELPEIIALPVVAGLPSYLDWIEQVTLP